jgi:hypothetical protein
MNNTMAVKTLLFDQQQFFTKEQLGSGLGLPVMLTVIYAVAAAVFQSGSNIMSASATIAMVLISWAVVGTVFFVFVNKLGHAECSLKELLAVAGYGSLPLLAGTILAGIAGLAGNIPSVLTALINICVLLWCIPVWVYGITAAANITPKQALTLITVPIIIMAALDLWSMFAGSGEAAAGNGSTAATMGRGGPPGGGMRR